MCGESRKDLGIKVMGDNLACPDMVDGARWLEDLGCDYIVHHIGYDERRGISASGKRMPSPLDQLKEVVDAVKNPGAGSWRLESRAGHSLSRIWSTVGRAWRANNY
jgi:3-keto-L-gulonate-6-phosphate decarboxylase